MIIPLDNVLRTQNASMTINEEYACPILTESIAQMARTYFDAGLTYLIGLIHEQGYVHCFNGASILEWYKRNPVHPITGNAIDSIHFFAINKLLGNTFQNVGVVDNQSLPFHIGLLAKVCTDTPLKNPERNAILAELSTSMRDTHPLIASSFFSEITDPMLKNPYTSYTLNLQMEDNPLQLEFDEVFKLWESENPRNAIRARARVRSLAERNIPFGFYYYANVLSQGSGGDVDDVLARRYLKKAADCGIPEAQTTYGKWCINGCGGRKNATEGRQYLRKAAGNWDTDALAHYAILLLNGTGGRKNSPLAYEYFKKAINFGSPEANLEYGWALIEGAWGINLVEEGVTHIYHAAKSGYIPAELSIAKIALEGLLVARSPELARHFLLSAQAKGSEEATQILVENDLQSDI